MKAAPITNKPDFSFMKQTDILMFYHIQIPRWLFFDGRYKDISLEAKMVYGFLLNRFQLSKLNGWINDDGEVFLIYTREDLSEELGISYRKTIACMKELKDAFLIWERRCGRGVANQIYLARVEQNEAEAHRHKSAPFVSPEDEAAGARSAETAAHVYDETAASEPEPEVSCGSRHADYAYLNSDSGSTPFQDLPESQSLTCENGTSATAESALPDLPFLQSNYIDKNNTDMRDTDKSLSVSTPRTRPRDNADGLADDIEKLDSVIEGCELWTFPKETAKVFENAIERLWFTQGYRIGKAVLPQQTVRSRLFGLDSIKLQDAERKIHSNTKPVKDSTAYVMAVVFNSISESDSDVLVDPYLNDLNRGTGGDSG